MKIPLSYSLRNLWMRRLTSILTLGGIGLVVFVFAAVLMLAEGLRQTLVSTGRDDNVLLIRKSASTEMISAVSRESADIVQSFPEVDALDGGAPFSSTEISVIINLLKNSSNDMGNVIVRGVSENALALRPQVRIREGRMIRPGTSEIVIGASIYERFKGCEMGRLLRFAGRDWTIVGIFDAARSGFESEVWCDVEQLMQAFKRPVFSAVTLRLRSLNAFASFNARLGADPRLQQLEVKREKQFYAAQSEMMSIFITILGLVITIIFSAGAVIGAMITMYSAVANRTKEIGTLRALGFRRRSILTAFLIESLILSLVGGGFGMLFASSLQFLTVSTVNWGSFSEIAFGFNLNSDIILNSLLFSVVMGLIGGFLPSFRAARLNIVTALRSS